MPEKFSTSNTYTAQEMVNLWTETCAQIAATGVSYAISGRSFACADPAEARKQVEFWEARVNSDSAPATNLVKFARR